jgi:VanZ family protein
MEQPAPKKPGRRILRILPVLLIMGLIFSLSHQEGTSVHLPPVPHIDKLGHFVLYVLLAGAALLALPEQLRRECPRKAAAVVFIFCLCYAVTDEVHQWFIPGREASLADLAADLVGSSLAVFLWFRRSSQSLRSVQCMLAGGSGPQK